VFLSASHFTDKQLFFKVNTPLLEDTTALPGLYTERKTSWPLAAPVEPIQIKSNSLFSMFDKLQGKTQ
jgi:hypothetical protein